MRILAWYTLALTVMTMVSDLFNKQVTKNCRFTGIAIELPVIIFCMCYLFR